MSFAMQRPEAMVSCHAFAPGMPPCLGEGRERAEGPFRMGVRRRIGVEAGDFQEMESLYGPLHPSRLGPCLRRLLTRLLETAREPLLPGLMRACRGLSAAGKRRASR